MSISTLLPATEYSNVYDYFPSLQKLQKIKMNYINKTTRVRRAAAPSYLVASLNARSHSIGPQRKACCHFFLFSGSLSIFLWF